MFLRICNILAARRAAGVSEGETGRRLPIFWQPANRLSLPIIIETPSRFVNGLSAGFTVLLKVWQNRRCFRQGDENPAFSNLPKQLAGYPTVRYHTARRARLLISPSYAVILWIFQTGWNGCCPPGRECAACMLKSPTGTISVPRRISSAQRPGSRDLACRAEGGTLCLFPWFPALYITREHLLRGISPKRWNPPPRNENLYVYHNSNLI